MVKGEVASCLHLNTQVRPVTGHCYGVSEFIVAGDKITTPLAGESVMANGIEHTPWTQGTHSIARGVEAQPEQWS